MKPREKSACACLYVGKKEENNISIISQHMDSVVSGDKMSRKDNNALKSIEYANTHTHDRERVWDAE